MKIEHALIMNIGKTANGFELTGEMVMESIDSFENVPIVYNKEQEFKDYTDENIENYKNEIVIGFIAGNISINGYDVFADIMIFDKYKDLWKGKYDNWCITFDFNKSNGFILNSIEVF